MFKFLRRLYRLGSFKRFNYKASAPGQTALLAFALWHASLPNLEIVVLRARIFGRFAFNCPEAARDLQWHI
ncbi:MAG: hypothetical protein DME96_08690 [Verrucomicrobia bacterium]|nr:MAG: hypothetical protein DME96_08690 [Verrucomicrobiota bacterium]